MLLLLLVMMMMLRVQLRLRLNGHLPVLVVFAELRQEVFAAVKLVTVRHDLAQSVSPRDLNLKDL